MEVGKEKQNKRRSQNDEIAILNGAPVSWASTVSSVGFAHPDIGESHADMWSAAAEIYARRINYQQGESDKAQAEWTAVFEGAIMGSYE